MLVIIFSKIGTRLEKKIKVELDSKKNEMSVYEKNIIFFFKLEEFIQYFHISFFMPNFVIGT